MDCDSKMEKIRINGRLSEPRVPSLAFGVWYGQHRVHEAQIDKVVVDGSSLGAGEQRRVSRDTKDGEHAKRLICGPHPAPKNRAYCEANFPGGVPPPSYLLGK